MSILFMKIRKNICFSFQKGEIMTQLEYWISLVEQRLKEKNWSKADLTQAVGLRSPAPITALLNTGKGSGDLQLRVSNLLSIREPWEEFKESDEK